MNNITVNIGHHQWNRILLKAYWYVLTFYVTVTSINLLVNAVILRTTDWYFIQTTIYEALLLGAGLGLSVMATAELLYRKLKHHAYADYGMITVGFLLCTALASCSGAIENIHALFFIPLLGSTLYFHVRKLLFACIFTLVSLLFLMITIPKYKYFMGLTDYLPTLAIVSTACVIAYGIYQRSIEVLDYMKSQTVAQEALAARKEAAERLIYYDALTGLYNHKSYHSHMEAAMRESSDKHVALHLALLDIDNFKRVNDTFGHWAGDAVLRWLGSVVRDELPPGAIAARYGGEEFAVIFPGIPQEDVLASLERIRTRVEEVEHAELQGRTITVSIGVKTITPGCTKEQLFEMADRALYQAKNNGKNQICS